MVPEINSRLQALAKEKKITYVDLFSQFTEKGTNLLRKELTYDGLHLNDEGYKAWIKVLKKYL
jgi:lysophospholipase L1-like esterase